jgi:hypothetical protein
MRSSVNRAADGWVRFWFAPQETSTLALVRILFGLTVLAWTLAAIHDVDDFFSRNGVLPSQPNFASQGEDGAWGILGIFDGSAAPVIAVAILIVASICLVVGYRSRLAALVVFLGVLSFERRNPFVFNSGDGLLRVIAFYMVLAPTGVSLSIDRFRKARDRFWEFPARAPWALRLIQIQLSVMYLSTVWAKLRGTSWNDGTAVSYALRIEDLERFPFPRILADTPLAANLMTYGTVLIELALAVLVWNRRLRPWVLGLGIGLHLMIDYAIRVGFFTPTVFVLYLAFLSPVAARTMVLAGRDRLARLRARDSAPVPAGAAEGAALRSDT